MTGKAKWDAWNGKKGTANYCNLKSKLKNAYSRQHCKLWKQHVIKLNFVMKYYNCLSHITATSDAFQVFFLTVY